MWLLTFFRTILQLRYLPSEIPHALENRDLRLTRKCWLALDCVTHRSQNTATTAVWMQFGLPRDDEWPAAQLLGV